tara:strand:- start:4253 stop:4486 length:234 start_codon:yes stop_codon:yes gene_type:complete
MEKFKTILKKALVIIGFILMPIAFVIWMIDRIFAVLMPKTNHKGFTEWLRTEEITIATVRIIIILIVRWLVSMIFGV